MSTTPELTSGHDSPLAERIQGARDQLTPLAADAPACEDIANGIIGPVGELLGGI